MLSDDEPRYAAIGREMAQSGDWVTPRLYGKPWFEKPALLYWMTAAGFDAGLGDDLAPRVPVAIVSVAFLIFYFFALRRLFDARAAAFAAAILGTSVGWLAFSHVAVTDLPMSAAFAAAMLLAMEEARTLAAGVLLGVAVLAKGLVPLALFVPALWFLRGRLKSIAVILGLAFAVAAPWYALVTARNGSAFLADFFWKQHFERFTTGALMHVQPFWFYFPVLFAGFFPWTPALTLLFRSSLYKNARAQWLATWFVWGFVLFSASENKLPGYVLPLFPALAALCGLALAEARRAQWVLAACAVLLWFFPLMEEVLPQALESGLSRSRVGLPLWPFLPVGAVAALCWMLERSGRRMLAFAAIVLCVTGAVVRVVWTTYPLLDRTVSARGFFRSQTEIPVCSSNRNRSWRYGLDYYAHRPIPDCK